METVSIIPDVKEFYASRLQGTSAEVCIDDYTRLASWLIKIARLINLKGKYSRNSNNMVIAKACGFETVDDLLLHYIESINKEKLNNFSVHNLRRFSIKIRPFIDFESNREAALISLISKKYGSKNRAKWKEDHNQVLIHLLKERKFDSIKELTQSLNEGFDSRNLDKVSYETVKSNIRKFSKQN